MPGMSTVTALTMAQRGTLEQFVRAQEQYNEWETKRGEPVTLNPYVDPPSCRQRRTLAALLKAGYIERRLPLTARALYRPTKAGKEIER